MRHLLNGVAIAAALAIAAPVWAQTGGPATNQYGQPMQTQGMPGANQSSPSSHAAMPATPAPSASSAAAPMGPMTTKKRAKRATRHAAATRHMAARHGKSRRAVASSGADTTNQLNREELARIQSGGSSAPPAGTNQYGQPMQTQGMPGANQSSPSSHPALPAGR